MRRCGSGAETVCFAGQNCHKQDVSKFSPRKSLLNPLQDAGQRSGIH